MAINEELDAYLRSLYGAEPVEFAADVTPAPLALTERPRFRNMLEGEIDPATGETVRPSALQRIRESMEVEVAGDRREADLLAEQAGLALLEGGKAPTQAAGAARAPLPAGAAIRAQPVAYLDALTAAQQQDELSAGIRRLNDPAEQLARIQSRGVYQPMGLAAAPSAVSQLQQRQQAVQDYLRQQREAERAPLEIELLRAQAERARRPPGGVVETEALKKLREATAAEREASAAAKLRPPALKPARPPSAAPSKEERITTGLRREFEAQPAVKSFGDVQAAFGKVSEAAKGGSPASDLSMLYSYAKLLDPGSVVRESEFQTMAQTGAFGDKVAAAVKKLAVGERLTDAQRADFVKAAKQQFGVYGKQFDEAAQRYEGLAKKSGVAPEDVVFRRKAFVQQPEAAPVGGAALVRVRRKSDGGIVEVSESMAAELEKAGKAERVR